MLAILTHEPSSTFDLNFTTCGWTVSARRRRRWTPSGRRNLNGPGENAWRPVSHSSPPSTDSGFRTRRIVRSVLSPLRWKATSERPRSGCGLTSAIGVPLPSTCPNPCPGPGRPPGVPAPWSPPPDCPWHTARPISGCDRPGRWHNQRTLTRYPAGGAMRGSAPRVGERLSHLLTLVFEQEESFAPYCRLYDGRRHPSARGLVAG